MKSVPILLMLAPLFAVLALTACGLGLEPPDSAAIPDGLMQELPNMPEAIGPIVEVGRGRSFNIGWRYFVYESADGTCTIVEQGGGVLGGACGGDLGPGPGLVDLGVTGQGSSSGSPSSVEGWVSDRVSEVWIELEGGRRVSADVMSLGPAGLEGQVFIAFVPEEQRLSQAVAVDAEGEVVATQPLVSP